uniref:Candidate secreted effector n=1 Tax=Meloidogyne incognita TaxID=6306 RepID=A0A914MPD5_MELIC
MSVDPERRSSLTASRFVSSFCLLRWHLLHTLVHNHHRQSSSPACNCICWSRGRSLHGHSDRLPWAGLTLQRSFWATRREITITSLLRGGYLGPRHTSKSLQRDFERLSLTICQLQDML